jgi:hypothetical protein
MNETAGILSRQEQPRNPAQELGIELGKETL